jgi:hypothetical protein
MVSEPKVFLVNKLAQRESLDGEAMGDRCMGHKGQVEECKFLGVEKRMDVLLDAWENRAEAACIVYALQYA